MKDLVKFIKIYFNLKKKNPISELCLKHGSDKGYLDYSATSTNTSPEFGFI